MSNWKRYFIGNWWKDQHIDLPYINEQFNDQESLDKWAALGYTQTKFTGDMYDMRNPEPEWIDGLRRYFPWKHFSWSVYRMGPGCVLPEHKDLYVKFREIYNVTQPKKIYRAVVFLEDWQQGHYFDIAGEPVLNWAAGDAIVWNYDVPHTAANVGTTNRYTLQITGVSNENFFT